MTVKRTIKPELSAVACRKDDARIRRVTKGLVGGHGIWQNSSSYLETAMMKVLDLH